MKLVAGELSWTRALKESSDASFSPRAPSPPRHGLSLASWRTASPGRRGPALLLPECTAQTQGP